LPRHDRFGRRAAGFARRLGQRPEDAGFESNRVELRTFRPRLEAYAYRADHLRYALGLQIEADDVLDDHRLVNLVRGQDEDRQGLNDRILRLGFEELQPLMTGITMSTTIASGSGLLLSVSCAALPFATS
jgi:hypothetical protein